MQVARMRGKFSMQIASNFQTSVYFSYYLLPI